MDFAIDLLASEGIAEELRCAVPGKLPSRLNTVKSDVLASLLESGTLSGMDAVFKQNTTRLSAVIHSLEKDFGWHIERQERAVGTKDGRTSFVRFYWLSQATISKAFDEGAEEWIKNVRTARAERRRKSPESKANAAKINAMRRNYNPRQGDIFEEANLCENVCHDLPIKPRSIAASQAGSVNLALVMILLLASACIVRLIGMQYGF